MPVVLKCKQHIAHLKLMLALTIYYFLYQELLVFVYRPVKKLHSAPLNLIYSVSHLTILFFMDTFSAPYVCTIILFLLPNF